MQHRITGGNVWQIAEQLTINNTCLRDLQNTNSSGVFRTMANTYAGTQYNSDSDIYSRSGILSHWAYLLANGKTGINDVGNAYTVYGVGMDQLENLIVRAVFGNFLDNTTSFAQVRTGMINAARSLCGNQDGVLVRQVINAWAAVNVGVVGTAWQPYISGQETVCPSATYTIANIPEGATVAWSSNNTAAATVNSSGVVTRVGGYHGNVIISALISDECGSFTITKTVNVGRPVISFTVNGQPFQNGQVCSGNTQYIDVVGHSTANSYLWNLQSGGGSLSGSGPYASFVNYNVACSAISVAVSNSCGTTNTGLTICTRNCFMANYKVYPNPAKDYLDITFDEVRSLDALPKKLVLYSERTMDPVKSLEIADVYEKGFKNGNTIEMDVKELPRGIYFLHIVPGENSDLKVEKIRVLLQ